MNDVLPISSLTDPLEAPLPAPPPAFAMSGHEEDRLQSALNALPDQIFSEAIEFAPAVSAFTRKLAARCSRLTSSACDTPIDPAARVVQSPSAWVREFPHSRTLPSRTFDLIVWSDVLCSLDDAKFADVSAYALANMTPRGHCLLVHWLHMPGALLNGDAAAERFIARAGSALQPLLRRRMPLFRVDLLERV